MRILAVFIGVLLLSGCAEYQERQAAARFEGYQDRCSAYGYSPGTPPYANCMQSLDQQDTANRQALIGAYLANQPHPQPQQPYMMPAPVPAPIPAPRSCTSMVNGQMIYTNCS